jgi:toxin-antitoxin system PIN domain toxin
MRALLDVNVLIALLDADHSLHPSALRWFAGNAKAGWASCPITQNGCVRVMSYSSYPNALPVRAIAERLAEATSNASHAFWADDVSFLDQRVIDPGRVHGPKQVTDLYLLALAVRNRGRLATFDRSIPLDAVRGAEKKHLLVL